MVIEKPTANGQQPKYILKVTQKAAIKREEKKLVYYPEREQARPKVKIEN